MNKVTVTVDDVTFEIAPTPLAKLSAMRAILREKGPMSGEGTAALIEAIFWGARRAGSQITLEWLQENVDNVNGDELFSQFLALNLLGSSGAGLPSGEATAASQS